MFGAFAAIMAPMSAPSAHIATTLASPGPTYASYLRLDEILNAQVPLSGTHDEMLFIVIHQASELWIKLCLHELSAARAAIAADDLAPALKMIARVSRAQDHMIQSWGVLATMTPRDFAGMRDALGQSSGLQSHQYRLMEFMMGAKKPGMIAAFGAFPEAQAQLLAELARPSLYDEAIRLLARRGFALPPATLERDFTQPYVAAPAVEAAWETIYRQPDLYWDLYDLAEKLADVEYRFQLWRFGHLKTIERIIGFKRGTGGTAGVHYLASLMKEVFFPELLDVRKAF
jgi:tryptophan 2,3-dioxygenase